MRNMAVSNKIVLNHNNSIVVSSNHVSKSASDEFHSSEYHSILISRKNLTLCY